MNTEHLGVRTLPSEAMEYMRRQLASGLTLGRLLLEIDLGPGTVTTYLPMNLDEGSILEFNSGGKMPSPTSTVRRRDERSVRITPVPDTDAWLASRTHAYLQEQRQGLVILENALARPSDPSLVSHYANLAVYDEEVYHVLTIENSPDQDSVLSAIRFVKTHQFVGVFTSSDDRPGLRKAGPVELTLEDLRDFARLAEGIVVGAYDLEGQLIWTKPGSLLRVQ